VFVGTSGQPSAAQQQLIYMTVHWSGIWTGPGLADATLFEADRSASIRFVFYDGGFNEQCEVKYDLSTSLVPAEGWVAEGGGETWQQVEVILSGGDSDCSELARGRDVRDVLEDIPWGIAHGPLDTLAADLETRVTAEGEDWAADWEPYVFGAYVWNGGTELREMGYAFVHEGECDIVDNAGASLVKAPAPVDAMPDLWVSAQGERVYTVPELINLSLF